MPEISDADYRLFTRYTIIGTPDEILKKREDLEKDNREQRDQLRATEGKVLKDGEVAVPKAKADLLPLYEELGQPKELKTQLDVGKTAVHKLTMAEQRTAASKFAKAAGLADESVETLIELPALSGATFEVRKGKVKNATGQEVDGDIAYLTLTGDGQKAMTFTDALDKIPLLKGLRMQGPGGTPTPGVPFVVQGAPAAPNGGSGGDVFAQIRAEGAQKTEAAKTAPVVRPIEERLGLTTR
jgi:hypothetical protein